MGKQKSNSKLHEEVLTMPEEEQEVFISSIIDQVYEQRLKILDEKRKNFEISEDSLIRFKGKFFQTSEADMIKED